MLKLVLKKVQSDFGENLWT